MSPDRVPPDRCCVCIPARNEAAALLREDGADPATIDAVLGRQHGRDRSRLRGDPALASVGAERWAAILSDTRDRRARRA